MRVTNEHITLRYKRLPGLGLQALLGARANPEIVGGAMIECVGTEPPLGSRAEPQVILLHKPDSRFRLQFGALAF